MFSSNSHVWMWELDPKAGWVLKNWCFQTVVLEKTLESPLDNRELKPVNLKRNQPWIFMGRTEAKAEAPVLWQPDERSWLIGKTQMLGKINGEGEGDDRRWEGWMASPTKWTWVWVNSRSSYVWMWELDHKEGWVPKNWCFQSVVLEKTLESPLDKQEDPASQS